MNRLKNIAVLAGRRDVAPYLFAVLLLGVIALQARLLPPPRPISFESRPTSDIALGSAPMESVAPPSPMVPEATWPVVTLPSESAPPQGLAAAMTPADTVSPLLGGTAIGRAGGLSRPAIAPPGSGHFDQRAAMNSLLRRPFAARGKLVPPARKAAPAALKPNRPTVLPAHDPLPIPRQNGLSGNAFTNHGRGPGAIGGPDNLTAKYGASLNGTEMRHRP